VGRSRVGAHRDRRRDRNQRRAPHQRTDLGHRPAPGPAARGSGFPSLDARQGCAGRAARNDA
jgi:hypothetical protein